MDVVKNMLHPHITCYDAQRKQVHQLDMIFALANLYLTDKLGLLAELRFTETQ